jgi:hypothetical protein
VPHHRQIDVGRVHVGHVVNLCVTHLGTMHLTRTCEMCGPQIVQCILDSLRMVMAACYLVPVLCVFHS